jgi:hypothetical protein
MKNKADWMAWGMQLVFGLMLGGGFATVIWLRSAGHSWLKDPYVFPFAAGCALLGAGLTSYYGDGFFKGVFMESSYQVIPPDKMPHSMVSQTSSVLLGMAGATCMAIVLGRNFGLF